MGQVIPRQHPAVVLRSQYKTVVSLLCVAVIAIVALATTVVLVANNDDEISISAQPNAHQQQILPPGTRFDGGPDEGTRGLSSYWQTSEPRTSYQPVPDEGFKARAGGPQMLPSTSEQHPGARP